MTSHKTKTSLWDVEDHLGKRGICAPCEVVEVDTRIGRSGQTAIVRSKSASFFVKHIWHSDYAGRLERESNFHSVVAQHLPDVTAARLIDYDADSATIVFDALPGAQVIEASELDVGSESCATASRLGKLLGHIHAAEVGPEHLLHRTAAQGVAAALIAPSSISFSTFSAAQVEYIALSQRSRYLEGAFQQRGESSPNRHLVHGDLRLSNVVYANGELVAVDWELWGSGQSAWDIASIIAELAWAWSFAVSALGDTAVECQNALECCRGLSAILWSSWCQTVGSPAVVEVARSELARCLSQRLFEYGFDSLRSETELNAASVGALQLSENLIRDDDLLFHLCAISPQHGN